MKLAIAAATMAVCLLKDGSLLPPACDTALCEGVIAEIGVHRATGDERSKVEREHRKENAQRKRLPGWVHAWRMVHPLGLACQPTGGCRSDKDVQLMPVVRVDAVVIKTRVAGDQRVLYMRDGRAQGAGL